MGATDDVSACGEVPYCTLEPATTSRVVHVTWTVGGSGAPPPLPPPTYESLGGVGSLGVLATTSAPATSIQYLGLVISFF